MSSPARILGPASLKPKPFPNGRPLTERTCEAVAAEMNAYCFEFETQGRETIWGCYDAATLSQKHALETVPDTRIGDVVTGCNCEDHRCRKRTCKHMVELAVFLSSGLRTRHGTLVIAASATLLLRSTPRKIADALRHECEHYISAVATASILTAAQVEEVERIERAYPVRISSAVLPDDWRSDWN